MIDALFGSYTAFDAALGIIIILSAIMSLARGFMRELATFGALFAAVIGAICGFVLLRTRVGGFFPSETSDLIIDLLVLVIGFVMVYIIVKMIAEKLTELIQGTEGITMVDRVAGLIFGIARGYGVGVFGVWLLLTVIPGNRMPVTVTDAASFPALQDTAEAITGIVPGIASRIQKTLANDAPAD